MTGETRRGDRLRNLMETWLPRIIAFVLALSFILLTVAFRSIVLPLRRSSSTCSRSPPPAASWCSCSRKGSSRLIGLRETEAVTTWVPLPLLSFSGCRWTTTSSCSAAFRSEYLERETTRAITYALATTARVITGAALIIIVVFMGLRAAARGSATGRLRSRHCAAHRRDDRALRAHSLEHEASRSLELVPAELAQVATRPHVDHETEPA